MAAESNDCCSIDYGKVFIRPYFCPTTANPNRDEQWRYLGNVSALNITSDINEIEQKNYATRAGGVDCYFSDIEALNIEMTLACMSKENKALALVGDVTESAVESVVDEPHQVLAEGDYILLEKLADTSTIVITDDLGATTYVLGTDYIIEGRTIQVLAGTTMALDSTVLVDYTTYAFSRIDIFKGTSFEIEVKFVGGNKTVENSAIEGHLYRVRLSPAESYSFIDDGEFKTVELSGKLLEDSQRTGNAGTYGNIIQGIVS